MVRSTADVESLARRSVEEARKHIPVTAAVIFGSYVDGTPHEHSDVDLAVFSPAVDEMTLRRFLDVSRAISKATDYVVEVHLFGETHLSNARPTNFAGYILQHGKRIA